MTDSAGDVIVAGQFLGSVSFGGNLLTSAGGLDYFIAKFGGSDGHHIWSYRYGDAADQFTIYLAIDKTDAFTITGRFAGSVDFGGGAMVGNGSSGYIAHFAPNAALQWKKLLLTAQPTGIASDPAGNVYYTGGYTGTVDFAGTGNAGAEVLTAQGNGTNLFLTKLASTGAHQFSRSFAGSTLQDVIGVGVAPTGEVTISGQFRKTPIAFSAGGVTATPLSCSGERNFYTASFTGAGAHRWSFCVGAAKTFQEGVGIAVGSAGDVFVDGDFYDPATTTMSFPGPNQSNVVLTRTSTTDTFIAKIAP